MSAVPANEISAIAASPTHEIRYAPWPKLAPPTARRSAASPRETADEGLAQRTLSLHAARPLRSLRPRKRTAVCAKCDGQQEASTRHYPRAHRSKQCVTAIDIPAMAQSSVAPSVTANSALSGTIAAEPRSAQGSARTASRRVVRPTEVGYVSCTPPAETRSGAHQRAISRSSDSWIKETAQ